MKDTFYDKVTTKTVDFMSKVVDEAKRQAPLAPGQKVLSLDEQIARYDTMTPQEMSRLLNEQGREKTEQYIAKMEVAKARRNGGNYGMV